MPIKPVDFFVDLGQGKRKRRRSSPVIIQRADIADWASANTELPIVATEEGLLLRNEDRVDVGIGLQREGASGGERRWWIAVDGENPSYLTISFGTTPNISGNRVIQFHSSGGNEQVGFFGNTPVGKQTGWSLSNVNPTTSLDADSTTLDELADIVGTIAQRLIDIGFFGT